MARRAVRRSQLVVPFGVGSLVDFPNESLMAAGLDSWPKQPTCVLNEDRLARRLGVRYFRQPPPAPGEGHVGANVPFVRFPLIHQCPRCGALKKAEWNSPFPPKCDAAFETRWKGQKCLDLPEKKRRRMMPVRFIIACEKGCVDDFPWEEWAHSKGCPSIADAKVCAQPRLRVYSSGKAGLMGVVVKCACGGSRSLMGAAGPLALRGCKCNGNRPWFGTSGRIECDCANPPRLLQRGASNLYFAKVASSILIPPFSDPIRKVVDDEFYWSKMTNGMEEGGKLDEDRVKILAEAWNLDPDALLKTARQKLEGVGVTQDGLGEDEFRYAEYEALLGPVGSPEDSFVLNPQKLSDYRPWVRDYFKNIVLVEKLAETRALTGFTRINPPPFREYDKDDKQLLWLRPELWLPAIRVHGEGLFFVLDGKRLDAWAATAELAARYKGVNTSLQKVNTILGRSPREITPQFVALHTFAHLLIRRLSFECGYGTASLRERVYCRTTASKRMLGLLIYTAAGDSEGTMGGLVHQGKAGRFEDILTNALEEAVWCSSDPVCIESPGQGTDSLNLAACHACCLLPETSCEEGNRFLDRAALVGWPEKPGTGLMAGLAEQILSGSKS